MKKLMHKINQFYKIYDLTFSNIKLTKADMSDHNALMSAYESLWLTMECYEDNSAEYQWMSALYGELGDYITATPIYKWQSMTMGNIVENLSEVIRQVWDSLVHYHTLDLKWEVGLHYRPYIR